MILFQIRDLTFDQSPFFSHLMAFLNIYLRYSNSEAAATRSITIKMLLNQDWRQNWE